MEWAKIKTIILVILVATNLALFAIVLHQGYQTRAAQTQARTDAISFLERNGISIKEKVVPESMDLAPMRVQRNLEQEKKLAAAMLGKTVSVEDRGGGVYRYSNDSGNLQFHSDGTFQGEFDPARFPLDGDSPGKHAERTMEQMGFTGKVVSVTYGQQGNCTVVLEQIWGKIPIFNLRVTLTYQNSLVSIPAGGRLLGDPVEQSGSTISVATALVQILSGLNTLGDVCNTIEEIVPGYVSAAAVTGEMILTPVWYIKTDTGDYLLDVITGELSRA